jgi:hypothetical protein
MEYAIGLVLALAIAVLAGILEFDKDRSFYPVILIVIAMYYLLFAVMGGNTEVIAKELIIALLFLAIAITGARISVIIVAVGLIVHGIFDLIHDLLVINSEVPAWWPGFCFAVDVALGIAVLYIAKSRSNKSLQPTAGRGG